MHFGAFRPCSVRCRLRLGVGFSVFIGLSPSVLPLRLRLYVCDVIGSSSWLALACARRGYCYGFPSPRSGLFAVLRGDCFWLMYFLVRFVGAQIAFSCSG